jgi:hypothetical protein
MSGSYYTLNAKYNQLLALIQKYIAAPGTQDLASVLALGISAGAFDIDLNNNDILNVTNINGSPYPPVVAADNLQAVLGVGNTATGANATISLTNSGVGYTTNPTLIIANSNATAGLTTGVPSIELTKTGRNGATGDVVGSVFFNALDGAGVERTFGKIESTITTNTAPSNYDGALDFYSLINGVNNLVFRLNGADNENNSFRPFDLNGNALKTSTGNLTIDGTSAPSGSGQIIINPRATSNLQINGSVNLPSTSNNFTIGTAGSGFNGLMSSQNANFTDTAGGRSGVYNYAGAILTDTPNSLSADFQASSLYLVNTANPADNLTTSITTTAFGLLRNDTGSGTQQNFTFDNNSASGGTIDYTNTIGSNGMLIRSNQSVSLESTTGLFFLTGLPTSIGGLPTGALWNNSGVLSIA